MVRGSCSGQRRALWSNVSSHLASVWGLGREPLSSDFVSHARGASVDLNRKDITNNVLCKLRRRVTAFAAETSIAAFSRDFCYPPAVIQRAIGS